MSEKPLIDVIVCSTRPNRAGLPVAQWFHAIAGERSDIQTRLIDIAEFGLPLYDETRHPRLGEYEHDHTKRWAESVGAADGFVFVAPEYNHGPTPALVNALSYLGPEWALKPAGFVSYGGRSGGLRAAQLTKPILSALKMYPVKNGVVVQMVNSMITDNQFTADPQLNKEANGLLNEMSEMASLLAANRASVSANFG